MQFTEAPPVPVTKKNMSLSEQRAVTKYSYFRIHIETMSHNTDTVDLPYVRILVTI